MIHCIAIDDEPKALSVIQSHISRIDFLNLKSTFTDPFKAIQFLNSEAVHLIFLDINMPDISGFEFLKHIPNKPDIIFTTAHSEYAIKSYEVEAIDYLLKPFDFSRFLLAATKVKNKRVENLPSIKKDFLFLNTGSSKQKILVEEILYVESDGNYVNYVTKNEELLVRSSFKEVLSELPSHLFVQVQRSFVVALKWINKVENNHIYLMDREIPIGSTFKEHFFNKIQGNSK
ncbi:MAG: LytTR family DNA-binding domain-containing protein [Balneolaceae bacterium]